VTLKHPLLISVVTDPELTRSSVQVLRKRAKQSERRVADYRRSLVERIGVMDLRFFGYFGDIDYGMRAHLAGFKLVCAKGAWLFHEGSGHVKREMAVQALTLDEARDRRMAMVETGYQEFRKKWKLAKPEVWAGGGSVEAVHFFDRVRPNAAGVPLKYDFPSSVMDDLEIY